MNQNCLNPALFIVACFLFLGTSGLSYGQAVGETPDDEPVVATKEYFVEQQEGEALVVQVSANEAQFISRLSTENEGVLATSGLPGAVTLPIYHFVAGTDAARQININVEATQVTNRSEFELQLTRLNVRDDRTASVASAYRLLSAGTEVLPDGNIPAATVRIQTLFRAANLFEEIGMQEMRLWSRIYGAYLVLYQLNDYQTAMDWSDDLLNEPRISRYPEIEFMARKLRSSAMAQGRVGAGDNDPLNSPLQQALAETAAAAKALDHRLEEAMALMAAGVDLIDQGLHRQARGLLESALAIAEEIEAADLAAAIREQMVEAYSQGGERDATGAILEDIETHLVEEGADQELALNLIQQSRVHAENYRFSQAAEVLLRAVKLEQGALSRLEAELELGLALTAAGQDEKALRHLYSAVLNPETGNFRRPSGVLKITEALYEIAAIHRHQGDWDRLEEIRRVLQESLGSPGQRAFFAYQRAKDSLQRHGSAAPTTLERFSHAFRLADSASQAELRHLARLGLCALPAVSSGDSRCQLKTLRAAFGATQDAAIPQDKAESVLFFARILTQAGEAEQAFRISTELIEALTSSGYAPLGSWYWHWRDILIDDFLELAVSTESSTSTASTSLLALIKARTLERGGTGSHKPIDEQSLQSFLQSLPGDTVVLSYYFTDSATTAWIGQSSGVKRYSLAGGDRVNALSREFRQSLQSGDLVAFERLTRELGSVLLEPIAEQLSPNIYLLNHASLLGMPVDALHVGGQPLASRHRMSNLELAAKSSADYAQVEFGSAATVFLAGDPQDWTGEFANRLEVSTEVRTVSDFFVGPGLHAVQGVALLRDEFNDARYGRADLIHLAVPGVVDLSPGRVSGLYLSEPGRGEGPQVMDTNSLASIPISARLAFLSRTEFSGLGSALENRTGIVSAMLDAGARAVIASLWAVEPDFRRRFVEDFYNRLRDEQSIISALTLAKRDSIASGESRDWASFQLFLN